MNKKVNILRAKVVMIIEYEKTAIANKANSTRNNFM